MIELRAVFEARDVVDMPVFAGSTLRGALGAGLKSTSCQGKAERSCGERCAWPARCGYGQLMETPVPDGAPNRLRSSKYAPHPLVLTPPESAGLLFPGQRFELRVGLVGTGMRFVRALVDGLRRLAELGVGKGRGGLALVELLDGHTGESVFDGEDLALARVTPLTLDPRPAPETHRLELHLVSPLQLMRRGNVCRAFDLGELVYASIDRFNLISICHGASGATLDAGAIAQAARQAEVKIVHDDTSMLTVQRYSGRQGRKHDLEGLVGKVSLEGDLGGFAGALRVASKLHVGKKISFGFGHVRVT